MSGQKIWLRAETKPAEARSACESLALQKETEQVELEELAANQRHSDSYNLQGFD
jgi:hypothetical protein